jgi:enediyne biosynthesis protein E4
MRVRSPALLLPLLLAACGSNSNDREPTHAVSNGPASGGEWFTDRAEQAGLDFLHFNGMSGEYYYPEILAPGVALFDADGDGDLDVFMVQGRMLGKQPLGQALFPPPDKSALEGHLFRNDLQIHPDRTRTLRFTDVTAASGIDARGYGMGVATGDFNNDGCIDLYVTNLGRNQLYRSNCNGTFTDISKQSRTDADGWSVSAAFVDYDRDGWLDLFVGHYVNYSPDANIKCFSLTGGSDYCSPNVYRAQPSRLYHNNRDGTFTDVTVAAGIAAEFGPALGVVTADFNGDGWIDIYVANDGQANQLWINQRNGTLKNMGLLSGSALSADGKPEASMGIDAGDFDDDGDEDLFVTNLTDEGSALYVNNGSGIFEDRRIHSGLRSASLAYTGFGTAWFDFDNDGRLDLLTVNGAVRIVPALEQAHDPFPLHQRNLLFRNVGEGRFEDVTSRAGAVFQLSEVGRGAAFGDVDNDGDVDVLVGNNSGPARLLINNVGTRNHWLGLRLVGEHTPRDMLGARVAIFRNGRPTLWRRARSDGSYASANDPRVLVGLGDSTQVPRVRVLWPDGRAEEWSQVAIDRQTTLQEGGGR